ncbi:hypothetical protein D0B88_11770 [Cellvibrio sp. KY-YJ-3]|nr:hypothetical protein D0B88_11770 [Cellvibrio sp. KY-YJ-3]
MAHTLIGVGLFIGLNSHDFSQFNLKNDSFEFRTIAADFARNNADVKRYNWQLEFKKHDLVKNLDGLPRF